MNNGSTIIALVVLVGIIQLLSPRGKQQQSKLQRAWGALWGPKPSATRQQ